MGWRSVLISRPSTLRREHFSLAIEQEQTAFVPFEDIALLILNHRDIQLNHPVLSACAEYGIGLFSTGDNHQPNGVFLPYLAHSRSTRVLRQQLHLARPLLKQAWAQIVRCKIENQAHCLRLSAAEGHARLAALARSVRSGDPENIESQAAAFYFPRLFGLGFHRAQERWVNAALNYGYAILRGAITRGLVAHGFHPSIGLFHDSEQNAFNLADDLIEPFRPLVDLHVRLHGCQQGAGGEEQDLQPIDKAALISLLNIDVTMPQGKMSVLSAIEYAVESLGRLFEQATGELELPSLIGLQAHQLAY